MSAKGKPSEVERPANDDGLSPNREEIRKFLKFFDSHHGHVIATIVPDEVGGRSTSARRFYHGQIQQAEDFIVSQNAAGKNIYHVPNAVKTSWQGPNPPNKDAIESCRFLYADLDPRGSLPFDEERSRLLAKLTEYGIDSVPAPSLIIDSGGGYQAYWVLEDELPPEQAEPRVLQLALQLDGDKVQNSNRMLRVAGTINYPNAKKRLRGRAPRLATICVDNHVVYKAACFRPATTALQPTPLERERVFVDLSDIENRGVTPRTRMLVVQGHDPDEPLRYNSRSELLFLVCCDLVRAGFSEAEIISIIMNPNFGISASVLDKKSPDAYALRQARRAEDAVISPELAAMNDKYAIIKNIGGKCMVMMEERSQVHSNSTHFVFQSFPEFRNRCAGEFITEGDKVKRKGDWWLNHPRHRHYNGVVFEPDQPEEVDGYFNLWRGFGVEARPGDWSRLYAHIHDVLAAGNAEAAAYITKWAAWAVQNPGERAGVALVFKGARGTGKSTFGTAMMRIFGRHSLHISSANQISGTFNAHMRGTSLLFADEAYWPGNKGDEGNLKRLITEPTLAIEAKGRDIEQVRNCLHIVMASNDEWIVPAGPHERRFVVLNVATAHMQDENWFGPLYQELDDGGLSAFLHDLLHYDLGDWHPRQIIKTEGLTEQMGRTLRPEEQFLEELLQDAELPDADPENADVALTEDLRRFATVAAPRLAGISRRQLSDFLKQWGCTPYNNGRRRGFRFPPLDAMRRDWEAKYGPQQWEVPASGWSRPNDVPF